MYKNAFSVVGDFQLFPENDKTPKDRKRYKPNECDMKSCYENVNHYFRTAWSGDSAKKLTNNTDPL